MRTTPPLPTETILDPYIGLRPYTDSDDDRARFFGREQDQAIIIANLYAAPLTVFYGASGVGKSSVLLAGVVPELRQTARFACVVFRAWQSEKVLPSLKEAILGAVHAAAKKEIEVDTALPLDDFLLQCTQALRGHIVLIFDQFEEYFLYHAASAVSEGFDAEFARSVNRNEIDASFLLSMREDGLSKLDRFQGRIPKLLNNLLRLDHLDRDAAIRAIREPLEACNKRLPPGEPRASIDDDLVEALLDQLKTGSVTLDQARQPAAALARAAPANSETWIETPFLQIVLTRLWDEEKKHGSRRLRLATLNKLGGAPRILRTHLDKTMGKLKRRHRRMAVDIFGYLVTPSGGKIAHTVDDLASYSRRRKSRLAPLLERLADSKIRVLRTIQPPPGEAEGVRYEIFHDVLAAAILTWRRRKLVWRRVWRAIRWTFGTVVVIFSFLAFFFFRQEKEVFANEEEHFKYGSNGAEGDRGFPYYLWLVLPRIFPDLMPGPGGYKSFGMVWEEGHEIPVGFSKKVVGFARVTNNCAICHTATYRLSEYEAPHVVVGGPGHTTNVQSYLRFLFKAAHDPRFNSDTIMNEIRLVRASDLSFVERQMYRHLLIPYTREALIQQEKQFTWMERYVTGGKPKPDWGPGRDDAMNLTKYFMTSMAEDNTFGPTDFPSIWNLGIRSGKDNAGKQMLLNWTGDTPAVRSVLIDSALALAGPVKPWFLHRMADLDHYLSNLPPPKWPFTETNPINQQMAGEGQKIYARDCASCHEPRAEFTNKVVPISEIGTDPERMYSWSKDAAAEVNRRVKQLGIDRPPLVDTQDPYGYVSPPLDGIWLRAPYLHNGSVPTLRDLLNPPDQRPPTFHRGYDVFDPVNVGFKEPPPRPVGPSGELKQPYFLFDTRQQGNGNRGHAYGTELSDEEKEKLLEYLKTL